jgi:GxxExxY protein
MAADLTQMIADERRKELNAITFDVIGAAHAIAAELGCGFLERVYENALTIELEMRGRRVEQQSAIDVRYRDRHVGTYFADLLVDRAVLVELKVAAGLDHSHFSQCVHYLRATNRNVCLLLNFGRSRLEFRRIVHGF